MPYTRNHAGWTGDLASRIVAACLQQPEATIRQVAAQVGTTPTYVKTVRCRRRITDGDWRSRKPSPVADRVAAAWRQNPDGTCEQIAGIAGTTTQYVYKLRSLERRSQRR